MTVNGQLPDLTKPTTAIKFAEMWGAGKLDRLSPGQQGVFLAALAQHIGVKAELGDLMIYQGKPYITISGYRRIAHNTGLLNGVTVRPASERDRRLYGALDGEHLWVAYVHKKGAVKPFDGWGHVRLHDRNPVSKSHPQEMAKKRAVYDALRLAFPPSEIIGDIHLKYIAEAEEESARAHVANRLAEGEYAAPDGEEEVVNEASEVEYQDDSALVDKP